jgi:hypothetical protein
MALLVEPEQVPICAICCYQSRKYWRKIRQLNRKEVCYTEKYTLTGTKPDGQFVVWLCVFSALIFIVLHRQIGNGEVLETCFCDNRLYCIVKEQKTFFKI